MREKRNPAASSPMASSPATRVRRLALVAALAALGILAAGLGAPLPARAADAASEREDLAIMERQLNLIDRLALNAQAVAPEKSRYHFDYIRLRADIARVRAGIQDYLNPPRAQPRDPVVLSDRYREASPSP